MVASVGGGGGGGMCFQQCLNTKGQFKGEAKNNSYNLDETNRWKTSLGLCYILDL